MMISLNSVPILRLAPRAHLAYQRAFAGADPVLGRYGINVNARRLAHFLAQVLHESGELRVLTESLDYAVAALLKTYVDVQRPRMTRDQALRFGRTATRRADQPAIANAIYGGAWGRKNLGNTEAGDGWLYRGHGLMQLTGRANARRISIRLREELGVEVDLVATPALAFDSRFALHIAGIFWADASCSAAADRDDVEAVTRAINGGVNGLPERRALRLRVGQLLAA